MWWGQVWKEEVRPNLNKLRHKAFSEYNMVDLKDIKDEVEEHVVPKIRWYLKWRTQIWSVMFMLIGIVGGSAATIQTYVPTLKYDTEVIEQRLEQVDKMSDQLIKIQEMLDKMQK